MYDSLIIKNFKCPHCNHINKEFELQTKSGLCCLHRYKIGDIFASYDDLRCSTVIGDCEKCNCFFDGIMNLNKKNKIMSVELHTLNISIDIKLK